MEVKVFFVVASLLVSGIAVFFWKYWHPVSNPTISNEQWEAVLLKTSMLHAISVGRDPHRAYLPLFEVKGPVIISASAVNVSKFVYGLHHSQAESSLAVLGLSKVAVNMLTCGAAGGPQYSYGHSQQGEEVWITCQYLMPKFNLFLSPEHNSWMKLNEKFLDNAKELANKGTTATHEDIRKFLAAWGEYFPTESIIGAELYSEIHKKCDAQVTEQGYIIEAKTAFQKDLSTKFGAELGIGANIGNKTTDTSESLVISCKGGVTEQLGRPGAWSESLADPTAWVPIELDYDGLVNILDLLPKSMEWQAKVLKALIKGYKAKKELEIAQCRKPILNTSRIKLKLSATDLYLATPQAGTFGPYPHVGSLPSPHIIELVETKSPTQPIRNGVPVRLIATVTTHGENTHLYSDFQGNAYYHKFKDSPSQKWAVKIVGKGEEEPLCDGDKVEFENMKYRGRKLYKYGGDNVGASTWKQTIQWQVFMSA